MNLENKLVSILEAESEKPGRSLKQNEELSA